MSRRESRDSDPKRQRSRLDREPSPKRSRRDGKPEAERVLSYKDLDVTETDTKPRQSLCDAAPLEPADAQGLSKDAEKKHSGHHETTKQAPHPSEGTRSRSYHQHDDRRSDGKDDRRVTSERGSWRSSRDQSNRRGGDDDKSQHRKDEDRSTWRHDRFHESDDTRGSLSRKRPAFREKKIAEETGNKTDRTRTEEATKDTNLNNRRQNERNWRSNMHSERPAMGSRQSYRAGRDRFSGNGRSGFHGSWTKEEKKWDHDLFDEANKSPGRANEEEQIAKVEALLAS